MKTLARIGYWTLLGLCFATMVLTATAAAEAPAKKTENCVIPKGVHMVCSLVRAGDRVQAVCVDRTSRRYVMWLPRGDA